MKAPWPYLILFGLSGCASQPAAAPAAPAGPAPTASAAPTAPIAVAPATPRPAGPIRAKLEPFAETLHGREVRDPYRWMERGGPVFDAFLDDQAGYARGALTAIPGRDQLRDALHTANHGVTRISLAALAGPIGAPRVFLWKREPDDDTAQLYVRDGWTGADRLVVDPRTRDAGGVHHTIDYATPSPDGKHLAYGISASGSEDSTIEVLDVDRGAVLRETIDRAQYANLAWRDNRSFFYWRRQAPGPGATRADWFKNSATYLHVLGDDPAAAQPVFGPMFKDLGLAEEDFSGVTPSPRSRWALAQASPGTSADTEYFVAPLAQVAPGRTPWRRVSGPNDHIRQMFAHGDTIYALSYAGAPRYQVLAFDAAHGTLATAKLVVPEGALIDDLEPAADAIYLLRFDGGTSRIERLSYDGKQRTEVALPFAGTAEIATQPDRPGVQIWAESWTHPVTDLRFEPERGVRTLALRPPWPIDYSHLTSEAVTVTSADGTQVPLSIVHRKDLVLDGAAPALLEGYQAYGSITRPGFDPLFLTWVDRGGVFATCHGRGSGDLGEQWRLDGTRHHKERGVEDFIACGEYLVAHKYTVSARLTVTGTSAGGILVGGAVTRRPDLYAVALLRVPMVNPLRFEATEGGPANVPELGTVADPEDFQHLLATDPYQRVADGTKYPAMVVTGGRHDVRVPIWQPAKFVARVQAATGSGKPILFRVES
ncbi:MAG TPA: prolyl oligopeptidase family serine peptidase, partial [Kofleriaceae bacterium]|nr:prolyl oligopeptidase family serine peptidase [Kofleriaceae bacterium]